MKRIFRYIVVVSAIWLGAGVYPRSYGDDAGTTALEGIGPTEEILDSDAAPDNAGSMDDDLDKLLDIAEKDLSQMSQMAVRAPAAGSLNTEVTTVNRTPSTVGKTPSAVYVIDNEMIRRSGAQSIPEVLRLAPGVNVARIDANKWAITIRGFNGRFSNKLLVQIDGRTVYTPLFAGVYWDVQDYPLEDVERIEIIRGPGATVWGANAVNGVINILTKPSNETQGIYGQTGAGTYLNGTATLRYGGEINENLTYRLYGKWLDHGTGVTTQNLFGQQADDDWKQARSGFRADWNVNGLDEDLVTIQGDTYKGTSGSTYVLPSITAPYVSIENIDQNQQGGNFLGRWVHKIDEETDFELQSYFDKIQIWAGDLGEDRDTWDVDFQYRTQLGERHKIVSGAGYRVTQDELRNNAPIFSWNGTSRRIQMLSYFIQDEITLSEDLWYFIAGSKFLHNTLTNFEYQPTARLLYTPSDRYSFWWSVSRAVRLPARADQDTRFSLLPVSTTPFPVYPQYVGSRGLSSETLLAWETGMHSQPAERLGCDVSLFFNQYDNFTSSSVGTPYFTPDGLFVPAYGINKGHGEAYGFEITNELQVTDDWKIQTGYSFLDLFLHGTGNGDEGSTPQNQFFAHSFWNLPRNVEFDLIGRYVDSLDEYSIPSYFVGDVRLGWRPRPAFEFFVVGRSLLKRRHMEFGTDVGSPATTIATGVPAEIFGGCNYRF